MKIYTAFFIVSLSLILSCSTSGIGGDNYYREVGYVHTTIANVNNQSVSFSNGLSVRTNRIIIAVNSTPVLLVIENYLGSGYFYLKKSKINFSSESDIEMLGLNRGIIQYVHDINDKNKTIILSDSTKWYVPNKEDWEKVDNWITDSEIIIPDNRPPQGRFFINTASAESILALQVDNTTAHPDK